MGIVRRECSRGAGGLPRPHRCACSAGVDPATGRPFRARRLDIKSWPRVSGPSPSVLLHRAFRRCVCVCVCVFVCGWLWVSLGLALGGCCSLTHASRPCGHPPPLHWQGNDYFNRSMRLWVDKAGWTLSDSGLAGAALRDSSRAVTRRGPALRCDTEEAVFDAIGVPYRPPQLRNSEPVEVRRPPGPCPRRPPAGLWRCCCCGCSARGRRQRDAPRAAGAFDDGGGRGGWGFKLCFDHCTLLVCRHCMGATTRGRAHERGAPAQPASVWIMGSSTPIIDITELRARAGLSQ